MQNIYAADGQCINKVKNDGFNRGKYLLSFLRLKTLHVTSKDVV